MQWLADNAITVTWLPTPLAEAVLEENWPKNTCLRTLHTAGDKLHRAPRKQLPFALYNLCRPTENTVCTTWALVPASDSEVAPPIGPSITSRSTFSTVIFSRFRRVFQEKCASAGPASPVDIGTART